MINRFIDQNLALANDLSGGGRDLNDDAITAFAKAAHALTDMSSPAHVGADGMPIGWSNGRAAGLAHVYAERNASVDWFRAGQGMRLEIAGYARAFPYLAKKHGNQDAWAQREIEHFVSSYFATEDPAVRNHVAEDAARQCALGNPAACGDNDNGHSQRDRYWFRDSLSPVCGYDGTSRWENRRMVACTWLCAP